MRLLRRLMPGTEPIECIGHFRVLPQDQEFACWREESGDCGVESERLSTLVRWNTPIVRAYYLKEAFQLFWDYQQPKRAGRHLEKWMRSAMRSRLEPFKSPSAIVHSGSALPRTSLQRSITAAPG